MATGSGMTSLVGGTGKTVLRAAATFVVNSQRLAGTKVVRIRREQLKSAEEFNKYKLNETKDENESKR